MYLPKHRLPIKFLRPLSTTTKTMPPPSPLPKYIYKILPSTPYYSFPIPIPASHEFVLSPLDAADGFLHFSTTDQLEGTLSRFFTKDEKVMLLKCDLERLSSWKVLKWDESPSGG